MRSIRILLLSLFTVVMSIAQAQDSLSVKNEIGFALNRYLPDLDEEFRPYFFSLEYRYNWVSTPKIDHLATFRISGNINDNVTTDPDTDKLFAAAEVGYRGRQIREGSKWFLSFGAQLGVFFTRESVLFENSETIQVPEPFTIRRDYYKFGFSPNLGFGYFFNEKTYVELVLAIGFSTENYGDVAHLTSNNWRGFSAQVPSIGIYRRF